jgi:hypothetical protein
MEARSLAFPRKRFVTTPIPHRARPDDTNPAPGSLATPQAGQVRRLPREHGPATRGQDPKRVCPQAGNAVDGRRPGGLPSELITSEPRSWAMSMVMVFRAGAAASSAEPGRGPLPA